MRIALFVYCIVGALVLACAITLTSVAAARLNGQYAKAHIELSSATADSEAAHEKLTQMQEQQRRDRALYTPQQAVQASFAVQQAQEAAQQAVDRAMQAGVADAQLKTARDRYVVAVLPLAVFFVGHILLAVMLRPRRNSARPAWKRGQSG